MTDTTLLKEPARVKVAQPHKSRKRRISPLWLFLVPAAIPYIYIVLVPSVQGAGFALTNWNGLDRNWSWVGFDNFINIFTDPDAMGAIFNTLKLGIVTAVIENIIGLLLALALNGRLKSRNALRLIFFTPVVIISVVVAYLWQYLYTPDGPVNDILRSIGLGSLVQNWLGNPSIALWAIGGIIVWQFSGYTMVIYLAGLQSVPNEQLEAAALDGAGSFQRFWYVIRPLLAPAITVNLMLSLTRGLMIFDQIWVTTQGGPAKATDSLSTLVYREAFQYGEAGYSAALAVILTLFVAVLGIIQYRLLLRSGKDT